MLYKIDKPVFSQKPYNKQKDKDEDTMDSAVNLNHSDLARLFFVIVLMLLLSHSFGYLFQRIKLPRVIGEICGGLVLGPSLLGYFFPSLYQWLFDAFVGEAAILSFIYWLGLVLLMFISGFEIQKSLKQQDKRLILALTVGSTALPFIAGWIAPSVYDFSDYIGPQYHPVAFQLIIAIAAAVTSIPVISKIFIDLDISHTRFAKVVLSTATVHDMVLWVALAIATGFISHATLTTSSILSTVAITTAFFVISLTLMPRLVRHVNQARWNLLLKASTGGYILFVCFLFSATAALLDVNIVFGALLAGIIIGLIKGKRFDEEKRHIRQVSLAFFTPIYFALVGLKIDLIHHLDWSFFLGFLLFSTSFQLIGTLIAARWVRTSWRSSANLSVAMITKGGPGIVLASVAYDLGIINDTFFVTLVLIAIVTSLIAGTWFKYQLNRGYTLLEESSEQHDMAIPNPNAQHENANAPQ